MDLSRVVRSVLLIGFAVSASRADEVGRLTIRAIFKGDPDAHKAHKIPEVFGTECAQFNPILTNDVQINQADPMTLKNVVVWIKSGPIDFRDPGPTEPVRITVSQCQITPHIVTVREGQPIYILNQDAVKHRLQLQRTKDKEFSVTLPKPGMQISLTMEAEDPVPLISLNFPWMKAWVAAFDHPYFATTGMDGIVRFSAFPPGDYEIAAWHEKFGVQTATVSVKAGVTTELDLVFESVEGKPPEPATKPAEPSGK